MRKARILWVAAAALLVAAFAGCSMNADSMTVGVEQAGKSVVDKITVDVNITNLSDYDTVITKGGAGNARTILPTFDADTANYDYYLYGISSTGVTFPETITGWSATATSPETGGKLKFDATTKKFKIEIKPGLYDFTIFAVPKDSAMTAFTDASTITSNAVLIGYSTVDLTSGSGEVNFTLGPDGLTGAGTFNLDLYLANEVTDIDGLNNTTAWELDTGYTMKVQLLNYITGEEIVYKGTSTKVASTPSPAAPTTPAGITKKCFANFAVGTNQTVEPGTYTFMVTFLDASNNEVGCWSDTLVILSQQVTKADVFIPKTVEGVPDEVSIFTATYIEDSENNPRIGFYKVHFQWTNDPINERFYEIQIADISGDTTVVLDNDAFTALTASKITSYTQKDDLTNSKKFLGSEERFEGSLLANNTDATFYLKLGHQYQARIRARNTIGASKNWTMVTLPKDSVTYPAGVTGTCAYFVNEATTPAAVKCINRFGITYHLNGGQYILTDGATPTWSNKNKTEYHCQDNSGSSVAAVELWDGVPSTVTLAEPTGSETLEEKLEARDKKLVQRSNIAMKAWVIDINAPTTSSVYEYSNTQVLGTGIAQSPNFTADGYVGYDNVTIYADYNTGVMTGTVAIDDPTLYRLKYSWLSYSTGGTAAGALGAVTNKISVKKSDAGDTSASITMSLALPTTETVSTTDTRTLKVDYDKVVMEVRDSRNVIRMTSERTTIATSGTPFEAFAINNLDNGIYSITFTATKTTSGNTIIRTLPLTVEITD